MKQFERLQNHLKKTPRARFSFTVVDCLKNPELAEEASIFATPTLVKSAPLPERRVIGNINDVKNVSVLLDIK